MLDSFLYSIQVIFPIFFLVFLGWLFGRLGMLSSAFFRDANRFVFKVTLPVTLYLEILSCGLPSSGGKLLLYVISGILALFLVLTLTVPMLIRSNDRRGAFIQGVYRSNIAILGVPLIENMFGNRGISVLSVVMPFSIILYNILAVVILSIFAPADKKKKPAELFRSIIRSVVTNPLIIGIVLALMTALLHIRLPVLAEKSLRYLSGLTMPLALMTLGATFSVHKLKGRISMAISASLLRTVIVPLLFVTAGALLGFRDAELGVIFVVFASPTAVSSYIMAENMGSDHELAGQIVLITTLLSLFTLFAGTFLLKQMQLI